MNFIGHLLVASWERDDAAFGLGAMLPDFASMAGMRPPRVDHAALAAGMLLHHRTDDVFHTCPSFVALSREVFDVLIGQDVERGPARAVAHIGVELLIDGALLASKPALGPAYLSALTAFEALPEGALASAERSRLGSLSERLRRHGIPYDYGSPELVTARLISILAQRPRLRLSPHAAACVGRILPDVKGRVVERLSELLSSLVHGLSHPRYSPG